MRIVPYRGDVSRPERRPSAGRESEVSLVSAGVTPAGGIQSPTKPGEVAHLTVTIENVMATAGGYALCVTDLLGVSGHRIPASHVRVAPGPDGTLAAGSREVRIEVRVPSRTPAGRYTGLLQAADGESCRTLVQLNVGADGATAIGERPVTGVQEAAISPDRASAISMAPAPSQRALFSYRLEHLAQVTASLARGEVIGATPEGLRINFPITGGRIVGRRFNATVESGGADALRIRKDGTAIVAVKTTLKTDDGARIFADYSGVFELGENGYDNALNGRFPDRPAVYLAPRFLCASPAYAWLNRLQCVGLGYVTMADLEVNYDLYAMRLIETSP
jgi:hypothetical protein